MELDIRQPARRPASGPAQVGPLYGGSSPLILRLILVGAPIIHPGVFCPVTVEMIK